MKLAKECQTLKRKNEAHEPLRRQFRGILPKSTPFEESNPAPQVRILCFGTFESQEAPPIPIKRPRESVFILTRNPDAKNK
ncbi:MAG: hypothetical protein CMP31_11320 [Roseibacillus sp.]|nr:hypothetical protein [Roseibacillus sp.]